MLDNFHSLTYFLPEIILSVAVLAILTVDLFAGKQSLKRTAGITLVALAAATVAILAKWDSNATYGLFGGLMAKDPMGDFFGLFFLAVTALVGIAAMRSKDAVDYTAGDKEAGEFYTLMLTTTVGMFLMATATDLLIAFLGLEMVSIMSYILSGFKRRNRASSEASLKYVIYGGVASGVMLYGMSLLYGLAGSTSLQAVRAACASTDATTTVVVAVILCLAGFGYKIASVPFHMWCPDVYQGAPTPVTTFLSVGPKAAGFALLLRFFAGIPTELGHGMDLVAPWPLLLGMIAIATMTLGNLAALGQSNLKRLLAYSSIAHAGYLLLGLCAGGHDGKFAILIYLVTYLFMNVGAFVVVLAIADAGGGEEVSDYRGLGKRAPMAALMMALFLFSLTGLPPFAGFFGKYFLFASLISTGGTWLDTLAVIGVLNSAISLFYYARVLKAMYFENPAEGAPAISVPRIHSATIVAMAIPTVFLFVVWGPLMHFIETAMVQWMPAVHAAAPLVHTALLP